VRNWVRNRHRADAPNASPPLQAGPRSALGIRRLAFAAVLVLALAIPSDATRDVPSVYGARHPGLAHSRVYPPLAGPDTPLAAR
jgi:hypothetical protein